LKNYRLEITSLGDAETRTRYLADLQSYIAGIDIDEETRARAALNPLRIFDDKRPNVITLMEGAPYLLDYLTEESAAEFQHIQDLLRSLDIDFQVNKRMVRGLDYYTGIAFEFVHTQLGAQSGIGGGGRYDGLMAQLGGQELSGVGFGMGIDRILLACEAEEIHLPEDAGLDLFIVPLGTGDRALILAETLRCQGVRVALTFGDKNLKGSMKSADKSGARFSLVLGEEELTQGVVPLKDMVSGKIESVTLSAIASKVLWPGSVASTLTEN
jgi:histidyl-tRNA synthetase